MKKSTSAWGRELKEDMMFSMQRSTTSTSAWGRELKDTQTITNSSANMSTSAWGRELKDFPRYTEHLESKSTSAWGRELKEKKIHQYGCIKAVDLCVRSWVERDPGMLYDMTEIVDLCVRSWVESREGEENERSYTSTSAWGRELKDLQMMPEYP